MNQTSNPISTERFIPTLFERLGTLWDILGEASVEAENVRQRLLGFYPSATTASGADKGPVHDTAEALARVEALIDRARLLREHAINLNSGL